MLASACESGNPLRRWRMAAMAVVALLAVCPGALAQTAPSGVRPDARQLLQLQDALAALPRQAGDGLLRSAPPAQTPSVSADRDHIRKARAVELDARYLAGMLAADDLRITDGVVTSGSVVHAFNLFDDLSVDVVKLSSTTDQLGNIVWRGTVLGAGGGDATLVIAGSVVVGDIRAGDRAVRIHPLDGVEQVIEYDMRSVPHDLELRPPVPPQRSDAAPRQPDAAAADAVSIKFMIAYTARAASAIGSGNLAAQASILVNDLNQTLANSGLGHITFSLTGIVPTSYQEAAGAGATAILNDLTNGVGDFARVQSIRATQGADLVQLWTYFTDYCGVAWLNEGLTSSQSLPFYVKYGTSVITAAFGLGCFPTSYGATTHEVGHNLGGNHDRYVVSNPTPGPQGYNYGYVDPTGKFRDTMAYSNQCDDLHVTCNRIPYFSNPNVAYANPSTGLGPRPVGIADANPAAADVARKISEVAPFVAQLYAGGLPNVLVAAVLPGARSVTTSTAATVFATIINSDSVAHTGCKITDPGALVGLHYQTTDGATNALTGTADTPATIAANAAQTFVLSMSSATGRQLSSYALSYQCDGTAAADSVVGVNTIDLLFSTTAIADIVALGATPTQDGILTVPQGGSAAFAVASVNVGVADTIRVTADTGSASLPLTLSVCQTDPSTGLCNNPPTSSVTLAIAPNATPTFTVFATASGAIPFAPATARIFLRFFDSSNRTHGSTSVAVKTP